jgi:hypothetical protein
MKKILVMRRAVTGWEEEKRNGRELIRRARGVATLLV